MSMADAFAPAENSFRNWVAVNTWGHLAPEARKVYRGYIVFALGCYGDQVVLQSEFENLPGSPWYFDDESEWVNEFIDRHTKVGGDCHGIWRFDGTYTKFKNGNYRFSGKTKVYCPQNGLVL